MLYSIIFKVVHQISWRSIFPLNSRNLASHYKTNLWTNIYRFSVLAWVNKLKNLYWKHKWCELRAAVVLWLFSFYQTHLLTLHQLQSPHHHPVNSEIPGQFFLPPNLLAEEPLPIPWRPVSPAVNTEWLIRVKVSWEKGYTQCYTWALELCRENKSWNGKWGIVICLL